MLASILESSVAIVWHNHILYEVNFREILISKELNSSELFNFASVNQWEYDYAVHCHGNMISMGGGFLGPQARAGNNHVDWAVYGTSATQLKAGLFYIIKS